MTTVVFLALVGCYLVRCVRFMADECHNVGDVLWMLLLYVPFGVAYTAVVGLALGVPAP